MAQFEVVSVNTNEGGVRKLPRSGPVVLDAFGLQGDKQANRRDHGGPDQAVCLYALEDYQALQIAGVTDGVLEPGSVGETLTTRGIDWREVHVGQRFEGAGVILEISTFRYPCQKLKPLCDQLPEALFPERRFGAYGRVLKRGTVQAGQTFAAISEPTSGLMTLRRVSELLLDETLSESVAARQAAIDQLLLQRGLAYRTRELAAKIQRKMHR